MVEVCVKAKQPIVLALISCFSGMKLLGVFLLPPGLDATVVHCWVTPSIKFAGAQKRGA